MIHGGGSRLVVLRETTLQAEHASNWQAGYKNKMARTSAAAGIKIPARDSHAHLADRTPSAAPAARACSDMRLSSLAMTSAGICLSACCASLGIRA